jgi:hypothetical protein
MTMVFGSSEHDVLYQECPPPSARTGVFEADALFTIDTTSSTVLGYIIWATLEQVGKPSPSKVFTTTRSNSSVPHSRMAHPYSRAWV